MARQKKWIHWSRATCWATSQAHDDHSINLHDEHQPEGSTSIFSRLTASPWSERSPRMFVEAEGSTYVSETGNSSESWKHCIAIPLDIRANTSQIEELLSNGSFDSGTQGWVLPEAWLLDVLPDLSASGLRHVPNDTDPATIPLEMEIGEQYFISYTITNPSGGAFAGSISVTAGSSIISGSEVERTTAGTYTEVVEIVDTDRPDLLVDLSFNVDGSGDFDGFISNISVRKVMQISKVSLVKAELVFYHMARNTRTITTSSDSDFQVTASIMKLSTNSSASMLIEAEETDENPFPVLDASYQSGSVDGFAVEDSTEPGSVHVLTLTPSTPLELASNERSYILVEMDPGTVDSNLERRLIGIAITVDDRLEND